MSSKLYRAGQGVVTESWRGGGHPVNPAASSFVISPPPGDAQARLQSAQQQAYAAGEAAGAQKAAERLAPIAASLNAMIQELGGMRARVRQEAEESLVTLAIAIARRVLHREIATDPEAILGLVKSAAEKLNAREMRRLRVAPPDAAILQQNVRSNLPQGLEIVADTSLPPGSAVFETSRGDLDASIGTQLDEIERGLTDLVRRRGQ